MADIALEERRGEAQDERASGRVVLRDVLQSIRAQDSEGGGGSVGAAARPDELSLPQSTAGEFHAQEQPFLESSALTSFSFLR